MNIWLPMLLCALSYLCGGVPYGYIVGKMRGVDVRTVGSGNIGATNVLRTLGVPAGVAVLLLDTLKGVLPVLAARWLLSSQSSVLVPTNPFVDWWIVAVGLFAVLGHTYTPFLGFNGGKGVATGLGVLFGLNWAVALLSFLLCVLAVWATRFVSVGSIVGALSALVLIWLWPSEVLPTRLFVTLAALLVVVRHRKNIERLRAGTESKIGAPKPETTAVPTETVE